MRKYTPDKDFMNFEKNHSNQPDIISPNIENIS
jgi:hypothetical protein